MLSYSKFPRCPEHQLVDEFDFRISKFHFNLRNIVNAGLDLEKWISIGAKEGEVS